jgi:hypothetical protein
MQAEKKPHSGYRVFAVFVFLFVLAFYGALWWYYRQHRCVMCSALLHHVCCPHLHARLWSAMAILADVTPHAQR